MSSITVSRPRHAELMYHVLAHLDLGADAASLHRPDLPRRPWVRGLHRAYVRAPGRLAVHALPLCTDDLEAMIGALEGRGVSALADEAGQTLADRLAAALDAERERVTLRLEQTAPRAEARTAEVLQFLDGPLPPLRQALWSHSGLAPRLCILDCDSLQRAGGTHGRAMTHQGDQVVAVSLAAPRAQVLCQLLHEEVHSITDPQVLAGEPMAGRDTRAGSEGFDLHRRLERRAVELGRQLVDAVAPELRGDYKTWQDANGG